MRYRRSLLVICAVWLALVAFTLAKFTVYAESSAVTTVQKPTAFSCSVVNEIPAAECQALISIYNNTGGPNWTNRTDWLITTTPCQWYGVSCSLGHVSGLSLDKNNLTGFIPGQQLAQLTQLSALDLSQNQLHGGIPVQLGSLSNLGLLYLYTNQLTGTIPSIVGNWKKLYEIDLSLNAFDGPIPREFGNLPNLNFLKLYSNRLSGAIPAELGNLPLQGLGLSENQLRGEIPLQLLNLCSTLHDGWLALEYNALSTATRDSLGCLNQKDLDWEQTQTVPPTNIGINFVSAANDNLTWTPISYTANVGYYEISYSPVSTGPYTILGNTVNKSTKSYPLTALSIGSTYYFRLRTYTAAHGTQQNELWSDYSAPVPLTLSSSTATPTSTPTPPTATPTATPTSPSTPAPPTKTWTLLIYADADNNLASVLGDIPNGMLTRLRQADKQPGVQVGILYDGPGVNDTTRYILSEDGLWSPLPTAEARMDDPATLRDFLKWGFDQLHTDYYYLVIADHANGVLGISADRTSNEQGTAYLSPTEIGQAIFEGTGQGAHKLNVVHFDGCSFGLFEDTSMVKGFVDYVIASPNTGWGVFAYDQYRKLAGSGNNSPSDFAQAVAKAYATEVLAKRGSTTPYTISVFNMAQYDTTRQALDVFGSNLADYAQGGQADHLRSQIRSKLQTYDSDDTQITPQDRYVDVRSLATAVKSLGDPSISQAADAVLRATEPITGFVLYEQHASGQFLDDQNVLVSVDLSGAHGLGIYYPYSQAGGGKAYTDYVSSNIFPQLTFNWGWTRFLNNGIPPLSGGVNDPPAAESLIAPLPLVQGSPPVTYQIFLPVVEN